MNYEALFMESTWQITEPGRQICRVVTGLQLLGEDFNPYTRIEKAGRANLVFNKHSWLNFKDSFASFSNYFNGNIAALRLRGKNSWWGAKSSTRREKLYVRTGRFRTADVLPGLHRPRTRYVCFSKNEFTRLLNFAESDITSRLEYLESKSEYARIAAAKIREHITIKAGEVYEAQIDYYTDEHVRSIWDEFTQNDFTHIREAAHTDWLTIDNGTASLENQNVIELSTYLKTHHLEVMTTFINAKLY